jgi:hypothetical protein
MRYDQQGQGCRLARAGTGKRAQLFGNRGMVVAACEVGFVATIDQDALAAHFAEKAIPVLCLAHVKQVDA